MSQLTNKRRVLLALILVTVLAVGVFDSFFGRAGADEGRFSDLRTVLEVAALIKTQYVDQ